MDDETPEHENMTYSERKRISSAKYYRNKDSPLVYEGGNSSEEDEMSVRTISEVAGHQGTSQSLEGVEGDSAEGQSQSPKCAYTREASVADALFKS
ncbi:hypothetical protein K438DRAFT_1987635 [Mycena galopus ATCC 62051]|nr:hypothetical protein K438DRAFT_1987635 [Mycena galopus ATCC 62051]